jgi:predicted metal-dependent HD superfamily phosphohydrolase
MRRIDNQLVEEAERFVSEFITSRLSENHPFHNLEHTLHVTANATVIGLGSGLDSHSLTLARMSALFHDCGYVTVDRGHEDESVRIAGEFLRSHDVDEAEIRRVTSAILATRVPQQPEDEVSAVLCDADLMHLAMDDYFERMDKLRLEWKLTGQADLSEYEFHRNSEQFFQKHHFHSPYGLNVLEPLKRVNLDRIRDRIAFLKSRDDQGGD